MGNAENLELMDSPEHPDLTAILDLRDPPDLAESLVGIASFTLNDYEGENETSY